MGKMAYEELQRIADQFVGLEVQLPYGQILRKCRGNLRAICFSNTGNHDVTVASTNKKGTYIHALSIPICSGNLIMMLILKRLEQYAGGIVESIQFNPNQSKLWIMRVFLKDGSIVLDKRVESRANAK